MKRMAPVNLEVKLPYKLIVRKKWVVSYCPALDVYSQGNDKEEAKRNLVEAISGFLLTCFEMNTLDEVLKNCGFSPQKETPEKQSADLVDFLKVPMNFTWNEHGRTRCHA
ncbi:hypothetical protein GF340_04165 [Candidatus Peregrinibacteria bacterium]|nr:hypothetical protein [Candidatus Peregrinibacteria bacterium]